MTPSLINMSRYFLFLVKSGDRKAVLSWTSQQMSFTKACHFDQQFLRRERRNDSIADKFTHTKPCDVEAIIAMILTLQGNIENADHSTLVMAGHCGTEWNKPEDLQVEGLRQFSGCHEWATGLFLFHLEGPTRPVEQPIRQPCQWQVVDHHVTGTWRCDDVLICSAKFEAGAKHARADRLISFEV